MLNKFVAILNFFVWKLLLFSCTFLSMAKPLTVLNCITYEFSFSFVKGRFTSFSKVTVSFLNI